MVHMTRDPEQYPAPHSADVHAEEVENFTAGGWVVADPLDHDGDGKKGGSRPRKKAAE